MSSNIPGNITKHSAECPQTFQGTVLNIPGNVLKHSVECCQTFQGMLPNIPGNVAKHSGEYPQTFLGMSSNISRNVTKHSRERAKHSGECSQMFRGMLPNIPRNTAKHSGECPQTARVMSVLLKGMRTQGQPKISQNSQYRILHGICSLLPLFIRGKLGTSKMNCGNKIQKKLCLFTFSSGKQAMKTNGSALLRYTLIISVQKLTQEIESSTAGFLRIQRRNRKILKTILK